MTLLDRIVKDGKLPEIETKVGVDSKSLADLGLILVLVAVVIIAGILIIKKAK